MGALAGLVGVIEDIVMTVSSPASGIERRISRPPTQSGLLQSGLVDDS